jgi:hypothetical protein
MITHLRNIPGYCKVSRTASLRFRTANPYTSRLDHEWSREETDYLFKLVKEYDSRFYVVADRYEFPEGQERSMEVNI